jgi:hypothetical protein
MDNNSSYTFQRKDGSVSPAKSVDAARDLLKMTGTDTSKIRTRDVLEDQR